MSQERIREHLKYREAYKGVYGMGQASRMAACDAIDGLSTEAESFLDVGCVRG